VQDGRAAVGVDEQIVVNGSVPQHVRNAVQRQRQKEIDVDANSILTKQFSTARPETHT